MSDTFMSDSEDDGGDFSASEEDEWLPEKSDAKSSGKARASSEANTDNSDESDVLSEEDIHTGTSISKGKGKKLAWNAKNGPRNSNTKSKRPGLVNVVAGKRSLKRPHQESDSSGDEHLVDPTKLDLKSTFFDAIASNPAHEAPQFDCNAGIGKLSDSSEEENDVEQNGGKDVRSAKRLITKINEASRAYVNFQDFTKTLETAKNQLASVSKKQQQSNSSDVSQLLALGELSSNAAPKSVSTKATKPRKTTNKQPESDSDWEEVEEGTQPSTSRTETVQITLKPEAATQKKKKCTAIDVEAYIKRMINRDKRDAQLILHKVTIIMGIAHGNFTNAVLNSPALLAIGNALIPSERCYPKGSTNIQYFQQIMQYYREIVDLKDRRIFVNSWKKLTPVKSLRLQLLAQMANCKRDYVLLFIILLRSIGIQCRMVTSLQVVPKVLPNSDLLKVVPSNEKGKVSDGTKKTVASDHDYGDEKQTKSNTVKKRKVASVEIPQLDGADEIIKPGPKRSKQLPPKETTKPVSISPRKTRNQRQQEANPEENSKEKTKTENSKRSRESIKIAEKSTPAVNSGSKDKYEGSFKISPKTKENGKRSRENIKIAEKSTPAVNSGSKDKNEGSSKMLRRDYAQKQKASNTKPPDKCSPVEPTASISSSSKKIVKIERFNPKTRKLLNNPVLSTDDESTPKSSCSKLNLWIEAFAEEEKRWVPLDVTRGLLDCVPEIVQLVSSPMLYVLAWNNDGSIKDVSARYCADYLTVAIKHRIMQQWMDNILFPYSGDSHTARDIAEDRELSRILEERPLPRTVSEYKNHPYFALKRHLLKFEAIYPPDAPTLGFTSGKEPVYARECVHTLHAREVWLKQARTVKMFETPYKIVSGRPKYDRSSGQMLPSQPLELFGHWQTEEYEPPTAENGIVPRNAYGNVELFKPCMLPKKTVHLQLPALNRVCKKLRIDCAQAVTGFDFHGGSSHPVYDGYVVCEEYRDIVVDAWHQEQQAEEQRAREKFEKRVYGNWKKLIKGLLIRRKLQHKYNFDNLNQ